MTMGEKIRECRKEAGYTQEELGKILRPTVNRAAVNKWECGYVENIKRTYIEQMAVLFDVPPADLMCFDTDSVPHRLSDAEDQIFDKFRRLYREDQILENLWRLDSEDQENISVIISAFLTKSKYRT